MKTSFRLRQRAHRRCEQVCMRYRRQIEGTIGGKRMFEQLRASVKLAQTLFARHLEAVNNYRAHARERRQAYEALRTALTHIVRISRIAARAGQVSFGLSAPKRLSTTDIVMQARAVHDHVSPHAEQLERHGLPAQVLRDLPLLIAVVDRAIAERDRARQFHVFANEAIRDALRSSDDAVVALDTLLRATPGVPPAASIELRIAKRVGQRGHRGSHADARHSSDGAQSVKAETSGRRTARARPRRHRRRAAARRTRSRPR